MPVYEFLCPSCHRVFSFFARSSADADREPRCPRCGGDQMRKQFSRFSIGRGASSDETEAAPDAMDDPRVERELMQLMREAEHMDESDPRQLGRLMRRMSTLTGEPLDGAMEEAVRRLEAGEDPERIEDELGDALDGGLGRVGASPGPSYDDGLYDF